MAGPAAARTFAFDGRDWSMVFNFEVISDFEETTGVSIIDVVSPQGGARPMISRLARLMQCALRPAHPDVTLDEAGQMMADPAVQALFMGGMTSAMPKASDTEDAGNAPKANRQTRRAAQSRSAGKTG